jgi:hypothetical protein
VSVGEEAPQASLGYQTHAWAATAPEAFWSLVAELRPARDRHVSLPPGRRSHGSQWGSATRYLLPDETSLHSPFSGSRSHASQFDEQIRSKRRAIDDRAARQMRELTMAR